jgi:hypothetical protein
VYPGFGGVGLLESLCLRQQGEAQGAQELSPEFRRKVLDLVKAGRPVRQGAENLQMPGQSIYVWLR